MFEPIQLIWLPGASGKRKVAEKILGICHHTEETNQVPEPHRDEIFDL